MINLIPPEGHKVIRREYALRVVATMCFLFGALALILGAAHIPTYILVGAQIHELALDTEKESSRESLVNEAEAEVTRISQVISQLRTSEKPSGIVPLIHEIESRTPDLVTLGSFSMNTNSKTNALEVVQVQGVAQNRESLAEFKRQLEASDVFATAEIPISDLARESNLTFTVTISLVTPL